MRTTHRLSAWVLGTAGLMLLSGCPALFPDLFPPPKATDDGPIAEGISAPLGEPIPTATEEQLATFTRGKEVLKKRFDLRDGLGPTFNVVSCLACHERPVEGGSAALYRNFFLSGRLTADGAFIAGQSAGMAGGVIRVFSYDPNVPARPPIPTETTIFAQRNSIPMFGVGLIAQIPEESILANADPDDEDGDGISGRPNYDQGFVGRFGRKCQTVSIEGFIRGPLFNHLGVTTVPLSDEQRTQLPVDSSLTEAALESGKPRSKIDGHSQAAAPAGPNFDNDGVPDPEMTQQELFDLVSFSMLLAAPEFEPLTAQTNHGRELMHELNCTACHVPRLDSPKGPIPVYSDLLLHDMGPELADGIVQGLSTGSEFRTQPLWGITADGPFLHDGRADTLAQAILMHGGEAQASRDAFAALTPEDQNDLVEFLKSLGGRSQRSEGLLPQDAEVPAPGQYGGPIDALSEADLATFIRGRAVFDKDFGHSTGIGGLVSTLGDPRFNGDSCRACHFDPVIGGAGPRDVNVMRHGVRDLNNDSFSAPPNTPNTILHKEVRVGMVPAEPADVCNVFEHRQTPTLFGMGLIDAIADSTIAAGADPDDLDGDGISGRVHILSDGRLGRFGWKADVPSAAEFVRDAMGAELGLTLPAQAGLTFGITQDGDGVADPELSQTDADDLLFFLNNLAPPPRQPAADPGLAAQGEALFATVGCTKCHTPSLPSPRGNVPLFSDLLLHEILPPGAAGIESGNATTREFRTAPLWGLSTSAPYFHSGEADTIDQAIRLHDGEALQVRQAYEALSDKERAALLAFLATL